MLFKSDLQRVVWNRQHQAGMWSIASVKLVRYEYLHRHAAMSDTANIAWDPDIVNKINEEIFLFPFLRYLTEITGGQKGKQ